MAGPKKKLIAQARQALGQGEAEYALVLLSEAHGAAPADAAVALLYAEALLAGQQPMPAIEVLAAHLAAKPRSVEAARLLSNILAAVTPVDFATVAAEGLTAALRLDRVNAEPLAMAAGLLLAARGEAKAFRPGSAEAALLIALLEAAPLSEPSVEAWLVARRRAALEGADGPPAGADGALLAAMARQVWLNEGIWPADEAERRAAAVLDRTDPKQLLLAALYLPAEDWCPADDAALQRLPGALAGLARQIGRERRQMARAEAALGPAIRPSDATGAAVAAQYEAHPYPRWQWVQAPPAGGVRAFLARMAGGPAGAGGEWLRRPLNIAVAGCGTGRQAVEAALAYAPDIRVLAFDLSRASLRYAVMKARQHRVDGVLRFRQADILDLPDFGAPFDRPFDLIECVGVLHHMADPFAGWRALLARLRPGGLMYAGLYSATARRDLTALRARLAGTGIDPADPDAIRRVRARILARPESDFERTLAESADFHTLGNARDLLFHAHEQPLTLEAIAAFLKAEGLEFLRMDIRERMAAKLAAGGGDPADLDAWAAFERDNPDLFEGMYLFWLRKPG